MFKNIKNYLVIVCFSIVLVGFYQLDKSDASELIEQDSSASFSSETATTQTEAIASTESNEEINSSSASEEVDSGLEEINSSSTSEEVDSGLNGSSSDQSSDFTTSIEKTDSVIRRNLIQNATFVRKPNEEISNWKTTRASYGLNYHKELYGLSRNSNWDGEWYESTGYKYVWFSAFETFPGLGMLALKDYYGDGPGVAVVASQTIKTEAGQKYRVSASFNTLVTNRIKISSPEARMTVYNGTAFAGGGALVNVSQQLPSGNQVIKLQQDFIAKSEITTIGLRMMYNSLEDDVGMIVKDPFVLEHMKVETTPTDFNVYSNYNEDVKGSYLIKNIPAQEDTGTITYTFPDKSQSVQKYTADSKREYRGTYSIPRSSLPDNLKTETGSIKSYLTDVLAINEHEGLPSEEYKIPINVYNIGAKAIPQLIKKGTNFTKKPQDIVRDEVILPGNTASYEYDSELPDTSTVGLKSVLVRMTDKNQPEQTTVIKVPVQVVDDPPTSGLYLLANDFVRDCREVANSSEVELEQFILKNSEAVGWDIASGSTDDISLTVSATTLKPNAKPGKYKATIKATKGSVTKEKDITITLIQKQYIDIVFLDETGEELDESVSLFGEVGSTIDLTKEAEVQNVITEITDKNYQVTARPENEMAFIVPEDRITLEYHFKGILFISSHPNSLNFGTKLVQGSIPFIQVEQARYDVPLVIWDNRKSPNKWSLSATLAKPLTSVENPQIVLSDAIRYKKNEENTVVLNKGNKEIIDSQKIRNADEYNVSKGWDSGKSGLQLKVPTRSVVQKGKYKATILWQLEEVP